MFPMTLMTPINITWDLQKHLLKIDIIIINLFPQRTTKNSTELSKYVWSLVNENKIPIINWKIHKIIYSKVTTDYGKLRLMEKLYILNALADKRCLNKKSEFISKRRQGVAKGRRREGGEGARTPLPTRYKQIQFALNRKHAFFDAIS